MQRRSIAVFLEVKRSEDRECLRGISAFASRQRNWVFNIDERAVREIRDLPMPDLDGVIARLHEDAHLIKLIGTKIPAVNLSASLLKSPIPRVCNDNTSLGEMAAEYFLARGYRNLVSFVESEHRGIAARQAAFEAKCTANHAHCTSFETTRESLDAFISLTRASASPIAVVTLNTSFAIEVIQVCHKACLPIPEKVALLNAVDDDLICGFSSPRLSTVRNNSYRVGYLAAASLAQQLEGKNVPAETLIPPVGVITRESTDMLATSDESIVRALNFIREHYRASISCHQIADAAQVSRRTLDRRFRDTFARSISEELRRVRVQTAQTMLVNTEDPVTVIAENCGFEYPERFTIVFKRLVGESPTAYRQRFRA